jgi:hypothetical protein
MKPIPIILQIPFYRPLEVYLLLRLGKITEARQKQRQGQEQMIMTNPFLLRTYVEILFKERDMEAITLLQRG